MTRIDWEININNLAERVEEKYGAEVAASAFAKAGATCFDDLSPEHYGEVFGDLMFMDGDD